MIEYGCSKPRIALAFENFQAGAGTHLRPLFDAFRIAQAGWLDDFGLFLALKEAHGGGSWLRVARVPYPALSGRAGAARSNSPRKCCCTSSGSSSSSASGMP